MSHKTHHLFSKVALTLAAAGLIMSCSQAKVEMKSAASKDDDSLSLQTLSTTTPTVVKSFEQIFQSMAAVTGVPVTNDTVLTTFKKLKPQLPVNNDLASFQGSHQMAVMQLAVEFCHRISVTSAYRLAIFPSFQFTVSPARAFPNDSVKKAVITTYLDRFWGTNLETLPDRTTIEAEMLSLLNQLIAGASADANGTIGIMTGLCTAALGSSPMTVF